MDALKMALLTSVQPEATIAEIEVAYLVLMERGDQTNPEHWKAAYSLHRELGRRYCGHRPFPWPDLPTTCGCPAEHPNLTEWEAQHGRAF